MMRGQRVRRGLLALSGVICVALGTLGIFVPGLPTTVFLLLASFAFSRSVPSLERRLREHRRLGVYLKAAERGVMPMRAKVLCLAAMWSGLGTALFALSSSSGAPGWGSTLLLGAGAVGSVAVLFGVPMFGRALRRAPEWKRSTAVVRGPGLAGS